MHPNPVRYKEQRRREDPTLNWIKVRETRSIKKAPIKAITSDVASTRPTRMKKSLVGCPYLISFENKQWNTCESMQPRLLPFLSRGHCHAWPCAGDSTHTPRWLGTPPLSVDFTTVDMCPVQQISGYCLAYNKWQPSVKRGWDPNHLTTIPADFLNKVLHFTRNHAFFFFKAENKSF